MFTDHEYFEVTGTSDEGTIVLLHLDGHAPIAFDRRMFANLVEMRGGDWPNSIRGRVRVYNELHGQQAVIYEDEDEEESA